jgi:MerC mercury resistance protein
MPQLPRDAQAEVRGLLRVLLVRIGPVSADSGRNGRLLRAALAALGLSALRKDAILWPVMLASLILALWGFWRGFRKHHRSGPLALGIVGALALASGVIVVHGPAAMPMIYGGSVALVAATFWNIASRHAFRLA